MCGIASFGETPLIYAARFGHTDAVARLIWLRADLTAQHTYSG
jgi:ankyrin repeat protein